MAPLLNGEDNLVDVWGAGVDPEMLAAFLFQNLYL